MALSFALVFVLVNLFCIMRTNHEILVQHLHTYIFDRLVINLTDNNLMDNTLIYNIFMSTVAQ